MRRDATTLKESRENVNAFEARSLLLPMVSFRDLLGLLAVLGVRGGVIKGGLSKW